MGSASIQERRRYGIRRHATSWRGSRERCWRTLRCGMGQNCTLVPVGSKCWVPPRTSGVRPRASGGPSQRNQVLLERIPRITDVQHAWALHLHSNARSNFYLTEATAAFARAHEGLWTCLSAILGLMPTLQKGSEFRSIVQLEFPSKFQV